MKTKPIKSDTSRLGHLREYDYFSFYSCRLKGVLIVREKTDSNIVYQHTETGKVYQSIKMERPVKLWTEIVVYQATEYIKK